ncbi:hypothetical protein Dimus_003364 [Dionaea muscipula]
MVPPSKRDRVYLPRDGLVPLAEATSILFQSNIEDLQQAFPCPRRFKLVLPEEGASALAAPVGFLALYQDHFANGLWFPLHLFMVEVLKSYHLVPAQLTPSSIGYITSFIILSERHGLVPSLEVFFRSMELKKDVLSWYEFAPRYHCALMKLDPFCRLWRRRFILVEAPDWPMNITPRVPVVRPDPSQLTRLSMLQADFFESLVLFHDRAPVPDFECVVNLESLEDHQIATRCHPRGGPAWLNYLYGERDNLWRLRVRVLPGGEDLSDAKSCSDVLNE